MKEKTYEVWALLRVLEGARALERPNKDASRGKGPSGGAVGSENDCMVATRVIDGHCECPAGEGGKCDHLMDLLQIVRFLGMTEAEVHEMGPVTVTGKPCEWIIQHCGGVRECEKNMWWGMTMPEILQHVRPLRNPKRSTRTRIPAISESKRRHGVPVSDRTSGFDPTRNGLSGGEDGTELGFLTPEM